MPSNDDGFRALFLPTAPAEFAVFAACVPLLSRSTKTTGAPSASATSPAEFSPASPAEGDEQMKDVTAASAPESRAVTTTGVNASAPHFAILSGRVDAAMVVLRNRQIVFFDLSDGKQGPRELIRIHPTPTVSKKGAPAVSNTASASATCAAFIPLDVAVLCATQSRSSGEAVYLRGVVGASDGRVSVFSEAGYAFSFTAHTGPVTRVEPVYLGFTDAQAASVDAARSEGQNGSSLFQVTAHLGFVTAGEDLRLFLWCRQAGAMQLTPHALLDGEVSDDFCCARAFTVSQARVTRGVACASGVAVPPLPAQLVYFSRHAQPVGLWSCLIARGSAAKGTAASVLRAVAATALDPRKVTALTVSADGALCLVACGTALYRVDLTVAPTSSSTVPSRNGSSRAASSSAAGAPALPAPVRLPLSVKADVTGLISHGRLVLAVCGTAGIVHVLALGDTPSSVARLGRHITFNQRPIRRVTLHARACLMTIVDNLAGSVELVQLPPTCVGPLMQSNDDVGPAPLFAAAAALAHKCALEDLLAGPSADTSAARAALASMAPSGVEAELEAELLARWCVPEACDEYLHPSHAIV